MLRRTSQCSRGMSLVEVLAVVVVMAIAAVVAAPLFGETGATRLSAAGRLLLADIQFAQLDSIAHPDQVRGLRFDADNGRYEVVTSGLSSLDCGTATAITNPADNRVYLTQYGGARAAELAGVSIVSHTLNGDACIGFGAYGQTDQATEATIVLHAGGENLRVTVDPVSGEATVESVVVAPPVEADPGDTGSGEVGGGGSEAGGSGGGSGGMGRGGGKGRGGGSGRWGRGR